MSAGLEKVGWTRILEEDEDSLEDGAQRRRFGLTARVGESAGWRQDTGQHIALDGGSHSHTLALSHYHILTLSTDRSGDSSGNKVSP